MEVVNILFIDSYDSFTYNLVRLLEQQSGPGFKNVDVTTIHNDTFSNMDDLIEILDLFDCVVVGPGPGNPINGEMDVGIIDQLFKDSRVNIPILGICLGFQAMCYAVGCDIKELETIKHGQVYPIHVTSEDSSKISLYTDYPKQFKSTRYHSLHVVPTEAAPIIPLAFTEDENGCLLMAAQVRGMPRYGVQYHPESCCSEEGGLLIKNFVNIAMHYNKTITNRYAVKTELRSNNSIWVAKLNKAIDKEPIYTKSEVVKANPELFIKEIKINKDPKVTFKLCDNISLSKLVMASASISQNRGEWSIIALPDEDSKVFTHYDNLDRTLTYNWRDPEVSTDLIDHLLKTPLGDAILPKCLHVVDQDKSQFWVTLSEYMKPRLINNNENIPFLGGLVGIFGYEMGLYASVSSDILKTIRPDAKLVFINNSIVIDHQSGMLYLISLNNTFPQALLRNFENDNWLTDLLEKELQWDSNLPAGTETTIEMPSKKNYSDAFKQCQEFMHKGDSYEICLTTQTKVTMNQKIDPWRIFQTLVQKNPAPFASFFEFNDIIDNQNQLCLLSTSPERFLKWNKDTCELRPIKGTVKKSKEMTLEKATEILKTPKEFGENLMILDLIRNDLYELFPNVSVEEFMSVEEYSSVYQLVSVVKAYGISSKKCHYSGLDILKHSLPPGSMTGAPKKMTVELLKDKIENNLNHAVYNGTRGLYSGVTGYWSVNGNGDWSVNIRCMYSYNGGDSWQLGAGGAITVLSTLTGELEEMYTKLESALQVFSSNPVF